MIDRELDIRTHDGAMNTFITHAEEGGPHPVVLLLMDAPGKREELHKMAISNAMYSPRPQIILNAVATTGN